MSRAIMVEISDPQRIFRAGEVVRGVVRVEVEKATRCDGLTISLICRTHGRGNIAREQHAVIQAFKGDWTPGAYGYPFEFVLPGGPVTYRGHLLNVEWGVHATADVPWALDPQDTQDLVLLAAPTHAAPRPASLSLSSDMSGKIKLFFSALLISVFALFGLTPCILGGVNGQPLGIVISALIFLVLAVVVAFMLRSTIAARKLGEVTMELEHEIVMPGEQVVCVVRFTPRSSGKLNVARFELSADEVVVSGSGTDRRTYTNTLHQHAVEVARDLQLSPGQPVEIRALLAIPQGAPPSVDLRDNDLRWRVSCQLDIPGWPDWSGQRAVWVLPLGSAPPERAPTAGSGAW